MNAYFYQRTQRSLQHPYLQPQTRKIYKRYGLKTDKINPWRKMLKTGFCWVEEVLTRKDRFKEDVNYGGYPYINNQQTIKKECLSDSI